MLFQCDGLTAQWLESEVRAITKAKAALVSALEEGGDRVRVTCRRWACAERRQINVSEEKVCKVFYHVREITGTLCSTDGRVA